MKTLEAKIDNTSEYFINSPSASIMEHFLYPTHLGHFVYLPGYRQHRLSFDSFLLMYVLDGTLTVEYGVSKNIVKKNTFVLIDCYQEHSYYSDIGWECTWIHFDGYPARKMYQMITARLGNIFSLDEPLPILNWMAQIYQSYLNGKPMPEILLSKYLNDILTELIIYTPLHVKKIHRISSIDKVKMYIQNHLEDNLRIEDLAKLAYMSTYYFIRVFKSETGISPHEYIVNHRIRLAKIYLLESNLTVSDISYKSGFSSESVFCAAFKKSVGMTPLAYRKNGRGIDRETPP